MHYEVTVESKYFNRSFKLLTKQDVNDMFIYLLFLENGKFPKDVEQLNHKEDKFIFLFNCNYSYTNNKAISFEHLYYCELPPLNEELETKLDLISYRGYRD